MYSEEHVELPEPNKFQASPAPTILPPARGFLNPLGLSPQTCPWELLPLLQLGNEGWSPQHRGPRDPLGA